MEGIWAKDEIRTRDPDLGKVVLYQLSYFRYWGVQIYTELRFLQGKDLIFFDFFITRCFSKHHLLNQIQNHGLKHTVVAYIGVYRILFR